MNRAGSAKAGKIHGRRAKTAIPPNANSKTPVQNPFVATFKGKSVFSPKRSLMPSVFQVTAIVSVK